MLDSSADRTKFEQLYTKYKRLIFSVAFKLLKRKEDAEDAIHSAFESIINFTIYRLTLIWFKDFYQFKA